MYEENSNELVERRFIFSDDFYNNLDSNTKEDTISISMPSINEQETVKLSPDIKLEQVENDITPEEIKPEENIFNVPINNIEEVKMTEVSMPVNTEEINNNVDINTINENELIQLEDLNNNENTNDIDTDNSITDLNNGEQLPNLENIINSVEVEDEPIETNEMPLPYQPNNGIQNFENNYNFNTTGNKRVIYKATRNENNLNYSNYNLYDNNPTKGINENYFKDDKTLSPIEETTPKLLDNFQTVQSTNDIKPMVINIDEILEKENNNKEEVYKDELDYENELAKLPATRSNLLETLKQKELETGKISILSRYGIDFCSNDYITNPAIGRTKEINELILILLTPEKSGILVGKPGIGKTSIVEGLAYRLQRNQVPDVLKGYVIVSVKTASLIGMLPNGETRLQALIDELKELDKIILFIDEIHMLMGATSESGLDFANMFKESLGRGSIKMIGATTSDEYERYILRDKAFVRRFQKVDVEEPTREQTIEIIMGTIPKIEKNANAKLKYSNYVQKEIMSFIVDITSEYKRVYGIGSRYPDICLTLVSQAFSEAVFNNRQEVTILDIRNAIVNSKNIYPDVIRKELINFDNKFKQLIEEERTI